MAEPMIETPLSSGATDVPNAPQSPSQGVNEASAVAAGYPVQHASKSLPAFDASTFKPLGQMSTSVATPATQKRGLPPVDMGTFKPLGGVTPNTQKETPEQLDQSEMARHRQNLTDVGTGIAKGVGQTVNSVSGLLNKIPWIGETLAPSAGVKAATAMETPTNTAQKIGTGAESIAEFFAGDEVLKGLSVAKKLGIAQKIAEYAKTNPTMAKMIEHAATSGRQGLVTTAQQLAHGASIGDALKTGAEAAGLGTAVGAVAEGAPAAYKATKGLISHSTLQEPLQSGIRDIVEDAAKTAPIEAAPEPNYAYRSRDAGEAGVPKAHAQSHGQATNDLSQAKTYAEPGQRGAVGGGVEKPQEVVRVDLNKLKPEDYKTRTSGGKSWTDFNRPLAEDEVTKVTPELEASEAAEKANAPSEPAPTKSIRKAVEQAGDKVHAASKADYKVLDDATNGRFQRFRDKLANGRRQLQNLSGSEEDVQKEASILKGQKETEDAMQEAFEEAKAKGIDPKLIDRADANFRKSQALYDLDNAVKKSTKGAHPDHSTPELLKESPETLNPKMLHSRINALYDSGRLQDALGEDGANKLFDHTLEHSGAYDKIMRNRKLGMIGGGAVLGAAGAGGYVAHKLAGAALGQ